MFLLIIIRRVKDICIFVKLWFLYCCYSFNDDINDDINELLMALMIRLIWGNEKRKIVKINMKGGEWVVIISMMVE